jgi:hypothetical protein
VAATALAVGSRGPRDAAFRSPPPIRCRDPRSPTSGRPPPVKGSRSGRGGSLSAISVLGPGPDQAPHTIGMTTTPRGSTPSAGGHRAYEPMGYACGRTPSDLAPDLVGSTILSPPKGGPAPARRRAQRHWPECSGAGCSVRDLSRGCPRGPASIRWRALEHALPTPRGGRYPRAYHCSPSRPEAGPCGPRDLRSAQAEWQMPRTGGGPVSPP